MSVVIKMVLTGETSHKENTWVVFWFLTENKHGENARIITGLDLSPPQITEL